MQPHPFRPANTTPRNTQPRLCVPDSSTTDPLPHPSDLFPKATVDLNRCRSTVPDNRAAYLDATILQLRNYPFRTTSRILTNHANNHCLQLGRLARATHQVTDYPLYQNPHTHTPANPATDSDFPLTKHHLPSHLAVQPRHSTSAHHFGTASENALCRASECFSSIRSSSLSTAKPL